MSDSARPETCPDFSSQPLAKEPPYFGGCIPNLRSSSHNPSALCWYNGKKLQRVHGYFSLIHCRKNIAQALHLFKRASGSQRDAG